MNDEIKIEETNEDRVKKMIDQVLDELKKVHSGSYDNNSAKKSAALALTCQFQMVDFLCDYEATHKGIKSSIKKAEADVYFKVKNETSSKISEAALAQYVSADEGVAKIRTEEIEAEKDFKYWNYIFGVVRESHLLFRSMANKSEW